MCAGWCRGDPTRWWGAGHSAACAARLPPRTPTFPCLTPAQDEVGVRLTQVDPGASDWRAMNLLTQYYARPQYL